MMRNATKGAALAALLLAGVALGGCLPPEEETVGDPPLGPYSVTIDFAAGVIPGSFTQTTPGQPWSICNNATECLFSTGLEVPGIVSTGVTTAVSSCIAFDPGLPTNFVQFVYGDNEAAGGFSWHLDEAVPFTSSGSTAPAVVLSPVYRFPFGYHVFEWCQTGNPGTSVGFVDTITYGAE